MEVIRNYRFELDEIAEPIKKIANNLEEMTRIQKMYGGSNPLDCDQEIQSLKLENDRLKRRNELMEDYIHAIACIKSKKSKFHGICDNISCPYYDHDKEFGAGACTLSSRELIEQEAADLIYKMEELCKYPIVYVSRRI